MPRTSQSVTVGCLSLVSVSCQSRVSLSQSGASVSCVIMDHLKHDTIYGMIRLCGDLAVPLSAIHPRPSAVPIYPVGTFIAVPPLICSNPSFLIHSISSLCMQSPFTPYFLAVPPLHPWSSPRSTTPLYPWSTPGALSGPGAHVPHVVGRRRS